MPTDDSGTPDSQDTDASAPAGITPPSEDQELAMSSTVNPQITDAVTQANVTNLGDAPALALGLYYTATAQALSLAAQNAVSNQQAMNQLGEAVTASAVALMLQSQRS